MHPDQETPQAGIPRWAAPWSHGWATLADAEPGKHAGPDALVKRSRRPTGWVSLALVAAVITQIAGWPS